jgi:hypothetical protein
MTGIEFLDFLVEPVAQFLKKDGIDASSFTKGGQFKPNYFADGVYEAARKFMSDDLSCWERFKAGYKYPDTEAWRNIHEVVRAQWPHGRRSIATTTVILSFFQYVEKMANGDTTAAN